MRWGGHRASLTHFRVKPSGADPEHRSEKKLAVQREGRRSTKGAWAL